MTKREAKERIIALTVLASAQRLSGGNPAPHIRAREALVQTLRPQPKAMPTAMKLCLHEGCDLPRKVQRSGRVLQYCDEHQREYWRNRYYQQKDGA